MRIVLRLWAASALGIAVLTSLSGCVVPGGGYERSAGVVYGVSYYEPSGPNYDRWAPGYKFGPPRRGDPHADRAHYEASPRAYRPAPPSRPMPSIPTHSRPRTEHDR